MAFTFSLVATFAAIGAGRGGGRAPRTPNMPSRSEGVLRPMGPTEARLTVIQVTDVYTLENFPSLKTLIADVRSRSAAGTVISVLTGDFLAPYLLSSVDKGAGMMKALAQTPVDYLTWGNHEADVDHRTVCQHVRTWQGKWLNSNMRDHEAMECQLDHDVVEVTSGDGSNTRRVGLVAVLSDDPALYSHFKPPGAFGGATIECPWETLREFKDKLEGGGNCDVVLPLQHTYVPDDHRTCREFDFPVVLSGHDHHRVDEVVEGSRLLKPGLDAIAATILELSWPDASSPARPEVRASFVETRDWAPDPALAEECARAYDALAPLRNTELARVPPTFTPLSSSGARARVCSMGRFICSLLLSSLNTARRQRAHRVDAVLLMGGNVRGGKDYPPGSFFSLEALEAEIKPDETLGVVPMPGWLIDEGVSATHAGDPIPGWMQYDDGVREEVSGGRPRVTHVGGKPLERDRLYRVATKVSDLTNGQSPPWTEYYSAHPHLLPPKGAYVNIHAELMSFFARNMWRKIWEAIAPHPSMENKMEACDGDEDPEECNPWARLERLDHDRTGEITVEEIHAALGDVIGLSVDENELSLAQFVHSFADADGDGRVTLKDFETFCDEMPAFYESQKWRLAFPRPAPPQPSQASGSSDDKEAGGEVSIITMDAAATGVTVASPSAPPPSTGGGGGPPPAPRRTASSSAATTSTTIAGAGPGGADTGCDDTASPPPGGPTPERPAHNSKLR